MTDSVAAGTPDDCLLILSDSLAYFGPQGGLPADDARIWPNIVGARCGLPVRLFGRIGWTSRDVWWAMTQDPNIWAAVPHARAVILAFGGMDSLPSPLPTALREQIRYVRPGRLRQIVRSAYQWVQPRASKIGWPVALPPTVTIEYLDKIYEAYSFNVIPAIGRAVTGDAEAYRYLVESIRKFPKPAQFADMIRGADFRRVSFERLTGGVVALHSGWRL